MDTTQLKQAQQQFKVPCRQTSGFVTLDLYTRGGALAAYIACPETMGSLPDKSPAMDVQADDNKAERGEILLLPTTHNDNGLKRDLKRRHINMIAIAGMIVRAEAP